MTGQPLGRAAGASSAGNGLADGATPRVLRVERAGELLGFVAIDSSIGGRSRGGLRLAPDLEEVEISDAARAMTLKYGLLGLPQGGAKAGAIGDPEAPLEQRRECLLAFGRAIEPLLRDRVYVPDADLGTRADDIRWMVRALGIPAARREWRAGDSGLWTAASVVGAVRAARRDAGSALAGATVAIEGFGAVGSAAARLLSDAGARVVAVSTSLGARVDERGLDVSRLLVAAERVGRRVVEEDVGGERLSRELLLELPVDVLVPCARRHSIQEGNADRVRARLVCPGANDPISPAAERALLARGVVSIPDFVANCGGVLGGTMAFAGIDSPRILRFIDQRIEALVATLLARSAREGTPLRAVAERVAFDRRGRVRAASIRPSLAGRVLAVGLVAYRRGWVPGWLGAAASPRYFDRLLRF